MGCIFHLEIALHRKNEGKDIYFISNSLDESVSREITINCKGNTTIWNPTTGDIKPINSFIKDGKTAINITLKPFEAVFIVFN